MLKPYTRDFLEKVISEYNNIDPAKDQGIFFYDPYNITGIEYSLVTINSK